MEYLNFDIRIEQLGDHCRAIVDSPDGQADETLDWPFDEAELDSRLRQLGGVRRRSTRRASPPPEVTAPTRGLAAPTPDVRSGARLAEDLGKQLAGGLFTGSVGERFTGSLARADSAEKGLRIRVRVADDAQWLAVVPWELLWRPKSRFLTTSKRTPVVRYVDLPLSSETSLVVDPPLRVLLASANAEGTGRARLDIAKEQSDIRSALSDLEQDGRVAVTELENATLQNLYKELQNPHHIFHFIGHGGVDRDTGQGVLLFEDGAGGEKRAADELLQNVVGDSREMRLAVLNSCEGTRSTSSDPIGGVARSLLAGGLPAVVAMQFEISDVAAIAFAGGFYETLANGKSVDEAMAAGRFAIRAQGDLAAEWSTPVLFSRVDDTRLVETTTSTLDADGTGLVEGSPDIGSATTTPVQPLRDESDLPFVSILGRCGRLARWATGFGDGPDRSGPKGGQVLGWLYLASALVAVAAWLTGVAWDFSGAAGPDDDTPVDYRGLLVTLNWPFILLVMPLTGWTAVHFLDIVDGVIRRVNSWYLPTPPNSTSFSEMFEARFNRFWRVWRVLAPAIVAGVVLLAEYPDWLSPILDAPWSDRDWSVAIRATEPPPAGVALALNTIVFGSEIVLISLLLLTVGVGVFVATTVARARSEHSSMRRMYHRNTVHPPNLGDVKYAELLLLLISGLALLVAITATIENRFRSVSGVDLGTVLLALATVLLPVSIGIVHLVAWYARQELRLSPRDVQPDRTVFAALVAVGGLVVVNLLVLLAPQWW